MRQLADFRESSCRGLAVILLALTLGACTYEVSTVDSPTQAQQCVADGGEIEVSDGGDRVVCVKEGFFTKIDRIQNDLATSIFALIFVGGALAVGIGWLIEQSKT